MSAPDTILMTQGLASVRSENILVTPTGGNQLTLGDALQGINQGTIIANSVGTLAAAGTDAASAALVTFQVTDINSVTDGEGVVLPVSISALGIPLLVLNTGTAAANVYGQGGDTIDTTDGTTGVTLTDAHRCFFTAITPGVFVSGPEGGVTS